MSSNLRFPRDCLLHLVLRIIFFSVRFSYCTCMCTCFTYHFLCFSVREHRELGVYVDKLTKHIVTDINEVIGLIDKGKKNR